MRGHRPPEAPRSTNPPAGSRQIRGQESDEAARNTAQDPGFVNQPETAALEIGPHLLQGDWMLDATRRHAAQPCAHALKQIHAAVLDQHWPAADPGQLAERAN